jgi:hypothetical protein
LPTWKVLLQPGKRGFFSASELRRQEVNSALSLGDAFPSFARSNQTLTFYPALAYGVDTDRLSRVNFIRVGNRGPSGIVYRIKVACGRSKQSRHNTWGGLFGKIADPKFHARKQTPVSKEKSSAMNSSQLATMQKVHPQNRSLHKELPIRFRPSWPTAARNARGLGLSQYLLENCVRL